MVLVGGLLDNGEKALSIPMWHKLSLVFVGQTHHDVFHYSMCTCPSVPKINKITMKKCTSNSLH